MQTSCGVDDYDVGAVSLSRRQGIESYGGRVGTHLLLHNGHTYALAPDANLLYGGSTECVGSTEIHLLARFLELISQFANGSCLANAVHTYNKNHIRTVIGRQFPILVISSVILGEQRCNLVAHDIVKFRRRHILVACHTFLDALDNLQGCVNTDIRCDKSLLKIIEHFVVDS